MINLITVAHPEYIGFGLLFVMLIGAVIVNWKRLTSKLKKKIPEKLITEKKGELVFYRSYGYFGGYSTEQKFVKEFIDRILSIWRYKTDLSKDDNVLVESKFNGVYYPFFDLDNDTNLDLFKKVYSDAPYAIFSSSYNRYWGILDTPYDNLNEIFTDTNWKVINDQKYVSFSKNFNTLYIRGLYENEGRKPRLYETNGNLSENFQLFINKMTKYYNHEALELSVLKSKDPALIIKFNRKLKLKNLNNES